MPNLYYSWLGTKHLKVMELHHTYGMKELSHEYKRASSAYRQLFR